MEVLNLIEQDWLHELRNKKDKKFSQEDTMENIEKGAAAAVQDAEENLDPATVAMQAMREGVIAEQDAVNLYEQLAELVNDSELKDLLVSVAREEKVHVGEFETALMDLDQDTADAMAEGKAEADSLKKSSLDKLQDLLDRDTEKKKSNDPWESRKRAAMAGDRRIEYATKNSPTMKSLDDLNQYVEKAIGAPPRSGLEWNAQSHRWINPKKREAAAKGKERGYKIDPHWVNARQTPKERFDKYQKLRDAGVSSATANKARDWTDNHIQQLIDSTKDLKNRGMID